MPEPVKEPEVKEPEVKEPEVKPIPFHEDLKVQEYIARQVDARLEGILSRFGPPAPPVKEEGDPLDKIAQELAAEEKIDPETAKSFVKKFKVIAEHQNKELSRRLDNFELTQKFSQVFNAHPDEAESVAPKMTEVFGRLNDLEKNFVLKSPDGAEFLFNKAYKEANRGVLPPSARANAGNPPTKGIQPEAKVGSRAALFAKANEAQRKGDRAGYEEIMQQINRL